MVYSDGCHIHTHNGGCAWGHGGHQKNDNLIADKPTSRGQDPTCSTKYMNPGRPDSTGFGGKHRQIHVIISYQDYNGLDFQKECNEILGK